MNLRTATWTMKKTLIAFILACLAIGLFSSLDTLELRAEEPRRAVTAIEMYLTKDYIVPHLNTYNYYNKPPLFSWVLSIFFSLFGTFDEWVVRLPSLLSFVLTAFLHFIISKKHIGTEAALLSSLFFLSSADLLYYGSLNSGEIDLFYCLVSYVQIISLFSYFHKGQSWLLILSYLTASIGFLTKGFPAIAYQGFGILALCIQTKNWKILIKPIHFISIFCFLSPIITYYYLYYLREGSIVFSYIIRLFEESSQRTGFGSRIPKIGMNIIFFPFKLGRFIFPWSLLILFVWKRRVWEHLFANTYLKFACLFLACNIPIYWLSGETKSRYLYLFYIFILSILTFHYLNHPPQSKYKRWFENFGTILLLLLIVAALMVNLIPNLKSIPYLLLKSALAALVFSIILYAYFNTKSLKIYYLILSLALFRIALNVFYFPAIPHIETRLFRPIISEIIGITKSEPIHLFGRPNKIHTNLFLGNLELTDSKLETAPLIPYQIPYYITKSNKQIMQFDSILQEGKFYIGHKYDFRQQSISIYYRFYDFWLKDSLYLAKLSKPD